MRPSRLLVIMFALPAILLVAAVSQAQTVKTVHSFNYTNGQYPEFGVLAQGPDGNLYGVTGSGGAYGHGTVYRQSSTDAHNVVLYNFSGLDGSEPLDNPILARDKNLYGSTYLGGSFNSGVLFKIDATGNLTVLYNFTGGADGKYPFASPIEAADGNFYGTTHGDTGTVYPTVYKLSPSGMFSTIYTFPSTLAIPSGGVIQANDGNLYANSADGGVNACGAVTTLTTSGVVKAEYSFDCISGVSPNGPLVLANDGNLYGTTAGGGTYNRGTIFKMDGTTGAVTFVYNFGARSTDGQSPQWGLTQGNDGDLYGTTESGGSHNAGSLFQFTLAGKYTQLYSFTGFLPFAGVAGLAQHTDGTFFGTTGKGGSYSYGTDYSLNMGLGPFVTFVQRTGKVGQTAQVLGQGLTGTTSVTFNGVPATSFKVVTDTYITAVVPSGATTGKVVVTTPGGALSSNVSFRILQ